MDTDEKTLVTRLQALEASAWETLCREASRMLITDIQIGFSCGVEQAEEVVQQSWVRAVRAIRRFDPQRGRLVTWLKGICRNEARRLLGREFRQIPLSQVDPQTLAALEQIDRAPLPECVLEQQELRGLVHDTVWELKPQQRSILLQKYMEEQSVAVIAAGNGQTHKAVESSLTRARQAFKAIFLRKVRGASLSIGNTDNG